MIDKSGKRRRNYKASFYHLPLGAVVPVFNHPHALLDAPDIERLEGEFPVTYSNLTDEQVERLHKFLGGGWFDAEAEEAKG